MTVTATAMGGDAAAEVGKAAVEAVELTACECCGLTEECTPAYIERIRERHGGRWLCGLCAEAVKDEIGRSERLITAEEGIARHLSFCREFRSPAFSPPPLPADTAGQMIAAVRQLLRRSLDSPRAARSTPASPRRKMAAAAVAAVAATATAAALARSESCFPSLAG